MSDIGSIPRSARPYLRFVVGTDHDDPRSLTGLFRFGVHEECCRDTPDWLQDELDRALEWFNDSLPVPPFRRRDLPSTAVCWFRSDAGMVLDKMWELAVLLREDGVPVRFIRSWAPGQIIYHDELQVVADRRWRRRRHQRR